MQTCDSTCSHCATDWWKWLKAREGQMRKPLKGATTTWSDAALTSVRPALLSVGAAVQVKSLGFTHTGTVLHNSGKTSADGRHWVKVAVMSAGSKEPWNVHFEHHDLTEVS